LYLISPWQDQSVRLVPDVGPAVGDEAVAGGHAIPYAVDGKQYVAIASATAIFSFGLFEPVRSVPAPKIRVE
jgi:hypothetical protein